MCIVFSGMYIFILILVCSIRVLDLIDCYILFDFKNDFKKKYNFYNDNFFVE